MVFSQISEIDSNLWLQVSNHAHNIEKELSLQCRSFGSRNSASWQLPAQDQLKVNVDGSFNPTSGRSACRGIIRNTAGTFVKGFFCNLRRTNALWAEMCDLLHGLKLARQLALQKVSFEIDYASVFQMVDKRVHLFSYHDSSII